MPTGVFEITDIPADKVETVIADFNLDDPPPAIAKTDQGGGVLWTITATYPGPGRQKKKFDG